MKRVNYIIILTAQYAYCRVFLRLFKAEQIYQEHDLICIVRVCSLQIYSACTYRTVTVIASLYIHIR